MIFENISLSDGNVANIGIVSIDATATIFICKDGKKLIADALDESMESSDVFEKSITESKAITIVEIVLAYDAQFQDMFASGRLIKITVSRGNPRSVVWHNDMQSHQEYSRSKCRVGDFIRPMLIKPPDLGYLKEFQKYGTQWLLENDRALLGDDMGLGKTVQAISALRCLFNDGLVNTALIVTPSMLCRNWSDELSRWAPELSQVKLSPTARQKDEVWSALVGRVHIILSNYEHFRDVPEILKNRGIDLLIFDEAHHVRNHNSQVTQGVRDIKSDYLWALSGTPLERDAEDIVTLLTLLDPGRYSRTLLRLPIRSIRARLNKHLLRRKKSEVLDDLPAMEEKRIDLELSDIQKVAYNDAVAEARTCSSDDARLALFTRLRTTCDYVRREENGKTEWFSSKADRIMELVRDISDSGDKAVVFSHLLEPLELLRDSLRSEGMLDISEIIIGEMSEDQRSKSLDSFKNDLNKKLLLCSSRLGGEGLNLTHANHVIYFNEWWNPSFNRQVRDRVLRIGQTKPVYTYKFRCKGTIEVLFDQILDGKEVIERDLIDKSTLSKPIHDLDIRDVLNKVSPL